MPAYKTLPRLDYKDLTLLEMSRLNWPEKVRYGVADKETRLLVHSSDSLAWIRGQLRRMVSLPEDIGKDPTIVQAFLDACQYQIVVRI